MTTIGITLSVSSNRCSPCRFLTGQLLRRCSRCGSFALATPSRYVGAVFGLDLSYAPHSKKMGSEAAIGIDLGTTYSCVGVMQFGQVDIIANPQGNRLTPSIVAFTDIERLIGDAAEAQAKHNPTNTIYDVKRIIGRPFKDSKLQDDMKRWPFKVVEVDGRPMIEAMYRHQRRMFNPEEISAMVLTKMKHTAEVYLGYKVTDAVITVPAYFNDAQRQATRDAGYIAGLNITRMLNEPTAAAIAYGMDKKSRAGELNVLVYDLGGGTFDVSILNINNGKFTVKAIAGDTHLGGEDFDNRIFDHMVLEIYRKYGKDIKGNARAVRRLKSACERAKRILSATTQTTIQLDSLVEGVDFYSTLTRARLEHLCEDIFHHTIQAVNRVLLDSGMDKSDIDEIILVGGSTRIPRIQYLLEELFEGKQLNSSVNPEEAVAYGAAVQAAVLNGTQAASTQLFLTDVTPLSLGIETAGGGMNVLIPRNSVLPAKAASMFSTATNNQSVVTVKVYEGERALTRDNHLLGEFDLMGIPPKEKGAVQIEVKFEVDVNGMLHVSAIDLTSGKHERVSISRDTLRLNTEEVTKLVDEARLFEKEDAMLKDKFTARNSLETYVYNLKLNLAKVEGLGKLSDKDLESMRTKLDAVLEWLSCNLFAERTDYERKQRELEEGLSCILEKISCLEDMSGSCSLQAASKPIAGIY